MKLIELEGRKNIMKKTTTMFVMMFLVFGMMTFVAAEELEIEEAGELPGGFFYGLDRAFDNFKVSMTFNKERKAERAMKIAEERLAEYEALILIGDTENAEIAKAEYDKFILKSEKAMDRIGPFKNSEKEFRNAARFEENIEAHQEKIDEIYIRILEKHGENMTDEQLLRFEEIFNNIKERSNNISERHLEKKNQIKTRHKILNVMTDEEVADFEEMIDREEGFMENREARSIRHEGRFDREIEVRERNLERMNELLSNENLTEEERVQIQERIELHESNFEEFSLRKEELREKAQFLKPEERRAFMEENGFGLNSQKGKFQKNINLK